jgi:hypothetical protein
MLVSDIPHPWSNRHIDMWPSIARARRRIGDVLTPTASNGATTPDGASDPSVAATTAAGPTVLEDVVIVLDGHDLDALRDALATTLEMDHLPDTPARLGNALSAAIRAHGGSAIPRVIRLPAGLSTPEAWEIRFDVIDPRMCDGIREAIRTGRFPA